ALPRADRMSSRGSIDSALHWGRVAQWESARFTRERSQVRNPPRPPQGSFAPAGFLRFSALVDRLWEASMEALWKQSARARSSSVAWSTSVGRLLPAFLLCASAEWADGVKGSPAGPSAASREAVFFDAGRRAQLRFCRTLASLDRGGLWCGRG